MLNSLSILKNKELLIVLYFFLFIFDFSLGVTPIFYDEFRFLQVIILITICYYGLFTDRSYISNIEMFFLLYISLGFCFWNNYEFIIFDILILYVSYRAFLAVKYNKKYTKILIFTSFYIFLFLPVSLYDYVAHGVYYSTWYPTSWNIRVYNSYFLIMMLFSTWFLIESSSGKYKYIYSLFIFLGLLSILLDGARSVVLSFTMFTIIICISYKKVRYYLLTPYLFSIAIYLSILYLSSFYNITTNVRLVKTTSNGRLDLWQIARNEWLESPIFGSGFYQLNNFPRLSAHPHNIFIQIITEIGIIGFLFLVYPIFYVVRKINWKSKGAYFLVASLLSVFIDTSLSGTYIYPITQMAILWFFSFLLKSEYFHFRSIDSNDFIDSKYRKKLLGFIFFFISFMFVYLFANSSVLSESSFTYKDITYLHPRFWNHGYQIF